MQPNLAKNSLVCPQFTVWSKSLGRLVAKKSGIMKIIDNENYRSCALKFSFKCLDTASLNQEIIKIPTVFKPTNNVKNTLFGPL